MHGTPQVMQQAELMVLHIYHRISFGMAIKYDNYYSQNYKPASQLYHVTNSKNNPILYFIF